VRFFSVEGALGIWEDAGGWLHLRDLIYRAAFDRGMLSKVCKRMKKNPHKLHDQ